MKGLSEVTHNLKKEKGRNLQITQYIYVNIVLSHGHNSGLETASLCELTHVLTVQFNHILPQSHRVAHATC